MLVLLLLLELELLLLLDDEDEDELHDQTVNEALPLGLDALATAFPFLPALAMALPLRPMALPVAAAAALAAAAAVVLFPVWCLTFMFMPSRCSGSADTRANRLLAAGAKAKASMASLLRLVIFELWARKYSR